MQSYGKEPSAQVSTFFKNDPIVQPKPGEILTYFFVSEGINAFQFNLLFNSAKSEGCIDFKRVYPFTKESIYKLFIEITKIFEDYPDSEHHFAVLNSYIYKQQQRLSEDKCTGIITLNNIKEQFVTSMRKLENDMNIEMLPVYESKQRCHIF